jgi:hypothetical protein
MNESAIERAVQGKLLWLKRELPRHDRGIVLALALSAIPVPPAPIAGLLLGVANYVLWKRGNLPASEAPILKISLLMGAAMSFVSLALCFAALSYAAHFYGLYIDTVSDFLDCLGNAFRALIQNPLGKPHVHGAQQWA